MRCEYCGAYVEDGTPFCTNCGNRMDTFYKTPKKKNNTVYILLAVILAALIGVLLWYFLGDRLKNEDANTVETTPAMEATAPAEETAIIETTPQTTAMPIPTATINVENEVSTIRTKYYAIENEYSSGTMVEVTNNGAQKYVGTYGKMKVVAPAGSNNIPYTQDYYYENNQLIFAYLEAADSYRLYFANNQLIRLRYCANASNYEDAVNHDLEDSSDYSQWEQLVLNAASIYL